MRESIQSLPSYLPEISSRVYQHVARPNPNPYQELQRSTLMKKYQLFLQQLNVSPVKPPMYELNMRVQMMRAELESKVKRSSRLSSLEPLPKRESVLSNYRQVQEKIAAAVIKAPKRKPAASLERGKSLESSLGEFTIHTLESMPSHRFSAYVTREVVNRADDLPAIVRRYSLTSKTGLEVVIIFDGVLAARCVSDGLWHCRSHLKEGFGLLRQRSQLKVLVVVEQRAF